MNLAVAGCEISHHTAAAGRLLRCDSRIIRLPNSGFLITPLASSVQQGEFTLEVVESLGVFSEYHGFVLIVDIFPFENFIDLMQCVLHRDFVRKIGRKHAPLRTDPLDDVGQRAFVSLAVGGSGSCR